MSDNDIFLGVQNPEDTMSLILASLKPSVPLLITITTPSYKNPTFKSKM